MKRLYLIFIGTNILVKVTAYTFRTGKFHCVFWNWRQQAPVHCR